MCHSPCEKMVIGECDYGWRIRLWAYVCECVLVGGVGLSDTKVWKVGRPKGYSCTVLFTHYELVVRALPVPTMLPQWYGERCQSTFGGWLGEARATERARDMHQQWKLFITSSYSSTCWWWATATGGRDFGVWTARTPARAQNGHVRVNIAIAPLVCATR
jgi:hypothetical protein